MAAEEKVEFFDFEGMWGRYIQGCGKPYAWFLRDPVHANTRGMQVLGRILEAYFAPRQEP
jgi:lysophospholipase L1-like esterase